MTLYLWDTSDYDYARGPMDLKAAKADGLTGVTAKGTEGTWVKHVHTADTLNRGVDAGIEFLGAYHVVRSTSIAAQVDYYLSYLDAVVPWWRAWPGWIHQIDLELWSYDAVSAVTGMAFAEALVAAQPKWVITYASRGQYGDQLAGLVTPLWNAAYGGNPVAHYPDAYRGDASANWNPYSGQTPLWWQYGSQLTIGSQPGADCSAYRGTVNDLRALIEGGNMTTADNTWNFIETGDRPIVPDTWTPDGYGSMPNNWLGTTLGKAQQDAARALAQSQHNSAKLDQILAALNVPPVPPVDLAAAVKDIKAEIRDAVADLGEGGAAQVRADPDA